MSGSSSPELGKRRSNTCRAQAEQLGPEVGRYMERILADHAMRNVRKAQAVLRLGQRFGATALEIEAARADAADHGPVSVCRLQ